ncbi:hypothetical protein ACWGF3_00680 [Streptomyces xanthophaeus]|uniref:Alpha/beta hydrolase n=1 Tax=Streptomyces xanthophaeus TaxID=67385 RepID=A0A919GW48_9ACTN|nr:hypothetical protein [Streptomyces xanthophaeus]GHI85004.1 hypothetical protein Sxan_23680 [Streptomyces xanthophaeus]
MASAQEWKLDGGTARLLPANGEGIVKPLILASKAGAGVTDLDALQARLYPAAYSFGDAVRASGYDLVLVGFDDGAAPLADLADTVAEVLRRTAAEQTGEAPLAAGGIGRGALAVRYALAKMESQAEDHRTATYVSFNGTAPSPEERPALGALGSWPRKLKMVKVVSGDFTSELSDGDFDDNTTGAADPGGLLISDAHGSWLLEHLA